MNLTEVEQLLNWANFFRLRSTWNFLNRAETQTFSIFQLVSILSSAWMDPPSAQNQNRFAIGFHKCILLSLYVRYLYDRELINIGSLGSIICVEKYP